MYEAESEGIVGFCSVIHFAHPINPRIKRVHRLVIHPDYQGIGLGMKLLNAVAEIYKDWDFRIITSSRNFTVALQKSSKWKCTRYGKSKFGKSEKKSRKSRAYKASMRETANTATFQYQK